MLQFSVLSSGSSGNALYVTTGSTSLLLDVGISFKQMQQRLTDTANADMKDIDAVLLTHEHIDHVRGLKQTCKVTNVHVYATDGTWNQVKSQVSEEHHERFSQIAADTPFQIGDIRVTPFSISHDAEEPVMYRFDSGDDSLAVVTDLGYVSDHIKSVIANCHAYVWEANHDVGMLRAGRYPWSVKRRILGDKGHLSNYDSAVALADIVGNHQTEVYLAHLSEENNQPDLAELTVDSVLREIRAEYGEQIQLHRTSRSTATALNRVRT